MSFKNESKDILKFEEAASWESSDSEYSKDESENSEINDDD